MHYSLLVSNGISSLVCLFRQCLIYSLFFIFMSCLYSGAVKADVVLDEPPLTPKQGGYIPLDGLGHGLWVIADKQNEAKTHFYRFDPSTAKLTPLVALTNCYPRQATETRRGIFIICHAHLNEYFVVNISAQNKFLSLKLNNYHHDSKLLALANGSLLIVGGVVNVDTDGVPLDYSQSVQMIYLTAQGALYAKQLADIPSEITNGYAVSLLPDEKVMLLGGSKSVSLGCQECSSSTYVLDIKTGLWTIGPKLLQGRTYGTVNLLPDGSLLVTGGWTTTDNSDKGMGSRSVEILPKGQSKFIAASDLLIAKAKHHTRQIQFNNQSYILIDGGVDKSLEVYDIKNRKWFFVGKLINNCSSTGYMPNIARVDSAFNANMETATFLFNKNIWLMPQSYCTNEAIKLRMPTVTGESAIYSFDGKMGIPLHYYGHFYAGIDNAPSIMKTSLRASTNISPITNSTESIEVTDIIWPDGYIRTLAQDEPLPANITIPHDISIAALPPINRQREDYLTGDCWQRWFSRIRTKLLTDGRVIIVGGSIQPDKVVALTKNAINADVPDIYIGVGDFAPVRTYEIYEPKTAKWRTSAPSKATANSVAIFNDGHVVQFGRITVANPNPKEYERAEKSIGLIEVSNSDGTEWTRLKSINQPITSFKDKLNACIFENNDELFISGHMGTMPSYRSLEWFNREQNQWVTLWTSHIGLVDAIDEGRIIIRQLPNGKRVLLPIQGY